MIPHFVKNLFSLSEISPISSQPHLVTVMSIDMNQNNLGYSVLEFDKNDTFKVIETGILDNSKINQIDT